LTSADATLPIAAAPPTAPPDLTVVPSDFAGAPARPDLTAVPTTPDLTAVPATPGPAPTAGDSTRSDLASLWPGLAPRDPRPVVPDPEPDLAAPGRHADREQTDDPLRLADPAPPLPVRQRAGDGQPSDTAAALPLRDRAGGIPERTPDGVTYTPAGLPWRVRQASLAPPLRATAPSRPDAPAAEPDEPPARGPEEIRRMMASYQTGTLRGRSEAARRTGEQPMDADVASAPIDPEPPVEDPEPPVERG
jgi:hypothetical protein